jgi:hypothetical protein
MFSSFVLNYSFSYFSLILDIWDDIPSIYPPTLDIMTNAPPGVGFFLKYHNANFPVNIQPTRLTFTTLKSGSASSPSAVSISSKNSFRSTIPAFATTISIRPCRSKTPLKSPDNDPHDVTSQCVYFVLLQSAPAPAPQ